MFVAEKPMPTGRVRPPVHVRFSSITTTTWSYFDGGAPVRPQGAESDGGGSHAVRTSESPRPRMLTSAARSLVRVTAQQHSTIWVTLRRRCRLRRPAQGAPHPVHRAPSGLRV